MSPKLFSMQPKKLSKKIAYLLMSHWRLQLVFHNSVHHLHSLISDSHDCPASSLKVFGQPLIVRNVDVACKVLDIDQVMIPNNVPNAATLIQDNFPSLEVEQFSDENESENVVNHKASYSIIDCYDWLS